MQNKSIVRWIEYTLSWAGDVSVYGCVLCACTSERAHYNAGVVVQFKRNAFRCARQLDIQAVETRLTDFDCDRAIKIADLKSNISDGSTYYNISAFFSLSFAFWFIKFLSASVFLHVWLESRWNGTTTYLFAIEIKLTLFDMLMASKAE